MTDIHLFTSQHEAFGAPIYDTIDGHASSLAEHAAEDDPIYGNTPEAMALRDDFPGVQDLTWLSVGDIEDLPANEYPFMAEHGGALEAYTIPLSMDDVEVHRHGDMEDPDILPLIRNYSATLRILRGDQFAFVSATGSGAHMARMRVGELLTGRKRGAMTPYWLRTLEVEQVQDQDLHNADSIIAQTHFRADNQRCTIRLTQGNIGQSNVIGVLRPGCISNTTFVSRRAQNPVTVNGKDAMVRVTNVRHADAHQYVDEHVINTVIGMRGGLHPLVNDPYR